MSYSKPFHNTLTYASTANIEEVIKFYNLGDKILKQTLDEVLSIKVVLLYSCCTYFKTEKC